MRFPMELHLAREWMSDQSDHVRGATLDLIATVAHHGKTMQAGHYTVRFVPASRAIIQCLEVLSGAVSQCCIRIRSSNARYCAIERQAAWEGASSLQTSPSCSCVR